MKRGIVIGVLLVLFVLFAGSDSYSQCAMCRGTVESSMGNGRNNVGVGLNTGIIYLFMMPYLLVAVIGYLWYRNSKKIREERDFITSRVREAYRQ